MIDCDFQFCIYNKDNVCALDAISVSSNGLCTTCIAVEIDEKKLDELKQKKLIDILVNKYLC